MNNPQLIQNYIIMDGTGILPERLPLRSTLPKRHLNLDTLKAKSSLAPYNLTKAQESALQTFSSSFPVTKIAGGAQGITQKSVVAASKKTTVDSRAPFKTQTQPSFTHALPAKLAAIRSGGKNPNQGNRKTLGSREVLWQPKSNLPKYDSSTMVVLGEGEGKNQYFRAFAKTVKKPNDDKDKVARLLPHRMKQTMRLYGVSPLVLLKRSHHKRAKAVAPRPVLPPDQTELPEEPDLHSRRIDGPEIAPNFGELNEFDFTPEFAEETDRTIQEIEDFIVAPDGPAAPELVDNHSEFEL
ncbi:hypothetical protein HDV03_002847 [Kappamyces sp. JEL0829]|nr:hypothetical protein HDV03_002847 [Kappamyces sp. JEL0829]